MKRSNEDLARLLGTYHWVWYGHPKVETEGITRDSEYEWGGVTLSLKPGKGITDPENVRGVLKLCMLNGTFEKKLVPVRGKRGAGTWDIEHMEWKDNDLPEDGHQLWVLKELDDNGHPFLGMYITEGYSGCTEMAYVMLAKRQPEGYVAWKGEWEELSDKEKERLGLFADDYDDSDSDEGGSDEEGQDSEGEKDFDRDERKPMLKAEQDEEQNVGDQIKAAIGTKEEHAPLIMKDEEKSRSGKRKADADSGTGRRVRRA